MSSTIHRSNEETHAIRSAPSYVRMAFLAIATAACLLAGRGAYAQDACRTANCAPPGSVPAACQNRAAPSTLQVSFVGTSIATYAFSPKKPKIEQGDCIRWSQTNLVTVHDSTHTVCNDDPPCAFSPNFGCKWDTGNVDTMTNPTRTCFYSPAAFPGSPGATGLHYYCRIHAAPNDTTGMVGDLRVTTSIVLTVTKPGGIVTLSWTGGGVTADMTFDVLRSLNDPRFTVFSTIASGGITTFMDTTTVSGPRLYSYLIRNKNV